MTRTRNLHPLDRDETKVPLTISDDGLAEPTKDGRIRITDRGLQAYPPPVLTRRERQRRRALALIAGRPNGCTTPVLLDYGIKSELLADLAGAGLVRMQKQPVIGSYGTEVTREVVLQRRGRLASLNPVGPQHEVTIAGPFAVSRVKRRYLA